MSKEAYYFSHDANARQDEKILMLRADHGWEGYGIYWALIEMMFESAETALHHNKIKGIAVSYNIDITVLENVINTCITENLFVSDGVKFWSESLIRRKTKYKELKEKKAEAGRKGMATRWGNQEKDNTVITDDNTVITKDNKGKESKENKSNNNYSSQFEEWWNEYPRKVEKRKAFSAFKTALKNYSFDLLLEGLKGYREHIKQSNTAMNYIKHPTTFLNGESFKDYVSETKQDDPVMEERMKRIDELYIMMDYAETPEEYKRLEAEREALINEVRLTG